MFINYCIRSISLEVSETTVVEQVHHFSPTPVFWALSQGEGWEEEKKELEKKVGMQPGQSLRLEVQNLHNGTPKVELHP